MAESKNTFTASKMNKDIDARLIPKGEYRDAINITVSRSEGEDVGTVQNIKGNIQIADFGLTDKHLEIIGYYVDEQKDLIYFFITNYTDTSTNYLSNFAPIGSSHYIYAYNAETNISSLLVSGNFLNFSKTHPVGGVDVIENILFWTDNRNQPRKININTALSDSSYYTTEDHISVTKYYPFQPIDLYKEEVTGIAIADGGTNWNGLTLPYQVPVSGLTGGTGEGLILTITSVQPVPPYAITGVEITDPGVGYTDGDTIDMLVKVGQGTTATFTLTVSGVSTMKNRSDEYLPPTPAGGTNANPDYDADWPGDPEYLKERFVRFSYRFKFDDDEYSLIAPFTQIAFVPRNDGYFLNETYNPNQGIPITDDSDEEYAYDSTVNRLMRNKIDEVGLIINSPEGFSSWQNTVSGLKIKAIDILMKDASETRIVVLDTLEQDALLSIGIDKLEYIYQSRKPIRTLPESDITRVYDKSPIRAKTLTAVGNRILYSNFYDKHTSPNTLDYNVNINVKDSLSSEALAIEYQNHTIKENRTYQVGIVLSDRYGRSSDVILSEVDDGVVAGLVDVFKGSTLYNAYRTTLSDPLNTATGAWPGDMLEIFFKTQIPSSLNVAGYPGLYSTTNPLGWYSYKVVVKQQEQEYYNAYLPGIINGAINKLGTSTSREATISLYSDNINKIPKDISQVGPSQTIYRSTQDLNIRVNNTQTRNVQFYGGPDVQKVTQISELTNLGLSVDRFNLTITGVGTNIIEYGGASDLDDRIVSGLSVVVRDTSNNVLVDYSAGVYVKSNYISATNRATVSLNKDISVAPYNVTSNDVVTFGPPGVVFKSNNNPLIGILSTTQALGVAEEDDFVPYLAVGETNPFESALDIYYESSTTGLISELNEDIVDGDTTTPYGLTDANFQFFEDAAGSVVVTDPINPVNADGDDIIDPDGSFTLLSVTDPFGNPVAAPQFQLIDPGNGTFTIATVNNPSMATKYWGQSFDSRTYTFTIECIVNYALGVFTFQGEMSNIAPSSNISDFTWRNGPSYNGAVYAGSLTTGSNLQDSTDFTGDGCTTTNGSLVSPDNINQYSELVVTNFTYTFVSATPSNYNPSGANFFWDTARVSNGTSDGAIDSRDNSVTGLGLFATGVLAQPNDPQDDTSTNWEISFDLIDANGGGLVASFTDIDVSFDLQP